MGNDIKTDAEDAWSEADERTSPEQLARELASASESIVLDKRDSTDAMLDLPDLVAPREDGGGGVFGRLMRKAFPVLDRPPAYRQHDAHDRRKSFTDDLPWVSYDPEERQFSLSDRVSKMACYDIVPIATEGRSLDMLRKIVTDLMPLLMGTVPTDFKNPWVLGIYGYFEHDLDGMVDQMRDYADERAKGSAYTEDYLRRMEQHYKDVTCPGGYFYDDLVSGTVWGGKQQRVRLVVGKRYVDPAQPEKGRRTPTEELAEVCREIENKFTSLGIEANRMTGEGFFRWMRWLFNQNPALCDGDTRRLDEIAPYPGDGALPAGADLSEAICIEPPEVDENGVWWFDGMANVVLQVESIDSVPMPGALTGEVESSGKYSTAIEKMPTGAMIAINVIMEPMETTLTRLEKIQSAAFLPTDSAVLTAQEISRVKLQYETNKEPLYPVEIAVYLRAPDVLALRKAITDCKTHLNTAGLKFFDPWMDEDPVRKGNFLRGLPGVMRPSIDMVLCQRTVLMHANHIMRIAPMFGRGRGTHRPGVALFNRSGEPLFQDLISGEENMTNGHTFIAGLSGSGKSALSVAMLDSIIAMIRPRIFVIDLGNCFEPLAMHAESLGLSTHVIRLNMQTKESMPPFADALSIVGQEIKGDVQTEAERRIELESFGELPKKRRKKGEDEDAGDQRDILGELEIIARLMISCGGGQDVTSATLKMVIRTAIKMAAEKAVRGELSTRVPRPVDIAAEIKKMSVEKENTDSRKEITEMANAMELYCEGLNDHLFNRDGEPWPECDLTVVDMADAGQNGRVETLVIAVVSLVNHVNKIAERDQHTGRPILFFVDEAHLVTKEELLMSLMVKITKMWRKLGARYWLATQEIEDIPKPVERMIGSMENWVTLRMPAKQAAMASEFRSLTATQERMMGQARMNRGKYAECTFVRDGREPSQARSVPSSLALSLSQTGPDEKAQRAEVMREHQCTEPEAHKIIAEIIRNARLNAAKEALQEDGRARKKRRRRYRSKIDESASAAAHALADAALDALGGDEELVGTAEHPAA